MKHLHREVDKNSVVRVVPYLAFRGCLIGSQDTRKAAGTPCSLFRLTSAEIRIARVFPWREVAHTSLIEHLNTTPTASPTRLPHRFIYTPPARVTPRWRRAQFSAVAAGDGAVADIGQ